jgi:hypothetical protein
MNYKTCITCKETKDKSLFYKKASTKDGYESKCRDCHLIFKENNRLRRIADGIEKPKLAERLDEALQIGNLECMICNVTKPLDKFKKDKGKRIGYRRTCIECFNKQHNEWFWSRSEECIEQDRAYRRDFAKKNRSKYTAQTAKYRAQKKQATPAWSFTEWEEFFIQEIYDQADRLTKLTGNQYHVDHMVPIISDVVCGLHCKDNLQIMLGRLNISKSNRYWPDMP